MRKIFFRVDYSKIIGSGHIIRCKTLIKKLIKNNEIYLIARADLTEQNIIKKIFHKMKINFFFLRPEKSINKVLYSTWLRSSLKKDAFQTKKILNQCCAQSSDAIVIDHYGVNNIWLNQINPIIKTIVIDDYIRSDLKSDIVINGNIKAKSKFYKKNNKTKYFEGTKYAIINPKYKSNYKIKKIKKILIFFSNSDLNKFYLKVLNSLKKINNQIKFVVVSGYQNKKNKSKLFRKNIKYYNNIKNFDKVIKDTTLAIGSCGSTYLQRLYYNIPSIIYSLSENQIPFCKILHKKKTSLYLGNEKNFNEKILINRFKNIISNKSILKYFSDNSKKFIDEYSLKRVLEIISPSEKRNFSLKMVNNTHKNLLFNWVNETKVIKNSIKKKVINYKEHCKWFENCLKNKNIQIFVLYMNNVPIGQIRFNKIKSKYIIDYSLDEFVRGRGYGTKLVKKGMQKLKINKFNYFEATVRKSNIISQKIFINLNFNSKRAKEFLVYRYVQN